MRVNYQSALDAFLDDIIKTGEKKDLLLHSCCGPCSSYVLEYLSKLFKISVLFYNPNIKPREEYELRLFNQRKIIAELPVENPVKILEVSYCTEDFERVTAGWEGQPERSDRCTLCVALRLDRTAKLAKELEFPVFCTTLTVSPHKDAEMINRLGIKAAMEQGVKWLPSDFKKRNGYKRSVELSDEFGLYRQSYCGCTPRQTWQEG